MKLFWISTLLVIGLVSTSTGQHSSYGISIGAGKGIILKESLEGGPSYKVNTSISIGLQYSRKLTDILHIATGINWYNNKITVTPSFHPNMDMTAKNYNLQLIYIPVFLRADLSNYFFVNGGLIGDFDVTSTKHITNQSGVGAGLGIGAEFPIKGNLSIQLNPYLNFHGLFLTDGDTYPERVVDSGIKLSFIVNKEKGK